jgi:hypothetical protein
MVGSANALALTPGARRAPTSTTTQQTGRTSNGLEGMTKTQIQPREAWIWTEEGRI